jgi:hypothetical protein
VMSTRLAPQLSPAMIEYAGWQLSWESALELALKPVDVAGVLPQLLVSGAFADAGQGPDKGLGRLRRHLALGARRVRGPLQRPQARTGPAGQPARTRWQLSGESSCEAMVFRRTRLIGHKPQACSS